MNSKFLTLLVASAVTAGSANAQSAVDAMQVAGNGEVRGTARFMGMGGAFTALGGDLSAVVSNPAGLGTYRNSDIGLSLGMTFNNTSTEAPGAKNSENVNKFTCNNFGYVGVANIGGTLQSLAWGVSYNRLSQFDRKMHGYMRNAGASVTNYIASYTNSAGYSPNELNFGDNYNPYQDSDADWLSILAFNSYGINDTQRGYVGLRNDKTDGDADLDIRERGYIDQYDFSFGGNCMEKIYWGIGVGVTDLSYTREGRYSESMANATVYSKASGGLINDGDAGYALDSYKRITGSGFNFKIGLIFLPVNQLRIGASVASPTYWSLNQSAQGVAWYNYYDPVTDTHLSNWDSSNGEETDITAFRWRLRSPWRFNLGVATVLDKRFIISAEFERRAYNDMHVSNPSYGYVNPFDPYDYEVGYESNKLVNGDIKNYYKVGNIVRIGAEMRITSNFSVRCGYNLSTETSKITSGTEVFTSGVDPSFNTNKSANTISLGLGVKITPRWYLDAAYTYTKRESTLHAFTDYNGISAPKFKVNDGISQAALSIGYRF